MQVSMESNNFGKIRRKLDKVSCLVLGDVMLDRYIYGEIERISPEAPIPIVKVMGMKENLGGAANVAANISHYGCAAYLCGVIGTDAEGNTIDRVLKDSNIMYCGLNLKNRITTTKNRIAGKKQQIVRFDEETTNPLDSQEEICLLNRINVLLANMNLVVISDYAKGVCTPEVCHALISRANANHVKVVVDPKGTEWNKYTGAYIVTPNWKEFTDIVGSINLEDDEEIRKKALILLEKYQLGNILITRSERGMTLVSRKLYVSVPAEAREIADVSGAGDTAIAALAVFLAAGLPLQEAVYWANRAAGLAVECEGTSVIGIEELIGVSSRITRQEEYYLKVIELDDLKEQLSRLKKGNRKIVFTNGCFDILHTGHIQYLNEAKKLGDFLIVAVNTDQSVRRMNKGENRPINGETDRALALAALQMVDAVIIFDEDTPLEILEQIRPDILVKGGDYRLEEIVGREYAGVTKVLSLKEGYSTTHLIQKIRHGGCDEEGSFF